MEITPASVDQVAKARNGKFVAIDADVGGVALGLRQIDPHIHLRFSETGEHYTIYWKDGDDEYLIFTAQELDQRIVKKMEQVHWKCSQPGYSFAAELDRVEAKAKADLEHERLEHNAPMFERLAHAMRRDLGYDKSRAFIGDSGLVLPGES